ncbi:MAG: DNA internalization-related competence protein ComEC/Rec2 [Thermoanaerobaculia bacterium]|nr:DNA internalization-related competence protein ComEC/Rec2 [Thermoanaerobaculia bacterium]
MIAFEVDPPWRLACRLPMVRGAVLLLLGVVLGRGGEPTVLPWLLTVVFLGLCTPNPLGRGAVWVAIGWAFTLLGGGTVTLSLLPEIALDRPVQILGRVAGCWVETDAGWTAPIQVLEVAQDKRTLEVRAPLRMGMDHLPEALTRCGGVVRARGYLVGPRRYYNQPLVEVGTDSLFLKSTSLLEIVEGPGWWYRGIGCIRERVSPPGWQLDATPGERLAHGLALGEAGAIDVHWREGLRRVGLSHVLAVSGLHLGLVAAWIALLSFRWKRGRRLLASLTALSIYGGLVGPQPSVLRAGVMAAIVVTALLMRRPPVAINALGLGVSMLIALDPGLIVRVGFQLSVAATAGIVLLTPGVRRNLQDLGRALLRVGGLGCKAPTLSARGAEGETWRWGRNLLQEGISVTLAAQIATLPWTLGVFHWFSPPAAIFNLLAVPWVGLSLALSLLWVGLEVLLPGLAQPIVGAALDLLTYPCTVLAGMGPSLWMGQTVVVGPLELSVALVALVAWSLRFLVGPWNHALLLIALGALAVGSPPRQAAGSSDAEGRVRVSMLDVGQGDAILLQDGEFSVLVDGGGWTRPGLGTRVLAPALRKLGIRSLNMVIVSHPDIDHCGGVLDLLRVLPVGEVVTETLKFEESPCFEELSTLDIPRRSAAAGDSFAVGGWSLSVLGPPALHEGPLNPSHNSRSLVLRAAALGRCVLLTGDIDQSTEGELRERWGDEALRCDLLKVAHHGSRSSTSPGWLYATRPRIALISVGRANRYGHPTSQVLNRLADRHIRTLRTNRDGQITLDWNRQPGWRVEIPSRLPIPSAVAP